MTLFEYIGAQPWAVHVNDTQLIAIEEDLIFYNILNDCKCLFSYCDIQLPLGDEMNESFIFELLIAVDKTKSGKYAPGLFFAINGERFLIEHTAIEELSFPKPTSNPVHAPSARIRFTNVTIHITVLESFQYEIAIQKLAAAAVSMNKVLKSSLLRHSTTGCRSTSFASSPNHKDSSSKFASLPASSQNHPLYSAYRSLGSWMHTLTTAKYLLQPVMKSKDLQDALISSHAASNASSSQCCLISLPSDPFLFAAAGAECGGQATDACSRDDTRVDPTRANTASSCGHPKLHDLMVHLRNSMLYAYEYELLEQRALYARDVAEKEVFTLLSSMYDDSSGSIDGSEDFVYAEHVQDHEASVTSELCGAERSEVSMKRPMSVEDTSECNEGLRKRLRVNSISIEDEV